LSGHILFLYILENSGVGEDVKNPTPQALFRRLSFIYYDNPYMLPVSVEVILSSTTIGIPFQVAI